MSSIERPAPQALAPRRSWPTLGERQLALGLGVAVALYGNAFSVVDAVTRLPLGGTVGGVLLGVGSAALVLRRGREGLAECGIRRAGLFESLLAGIILGFVMGLPGALYFLLADWAPVAVQHEAVEAMSLSAFLAIILLKIPFATALAEELAFRGLLQARLRAAFGPRSAILIGALVFTAWHFVVSFTTLQGTSLAADPGGAALAYLGQNVTVLAAGLIWGYLRERSGNLAGPIVSHWLTDVLLISGLYLA